MLGRLLHLGSGGSVAPLAPANSSASSRPVLSLESVQEDLHTRNLLFPDVQALYQQRNDQVFPLSSHSPATSAAAAHAFDYSDDVDIDVRDVRVIILQDALGPANAALLFDSHPGPDASASLLERPPVRSDTRRAPMSPRKPSHGHSPRPTPAQAESPQMRHGAFDRRASVHSKTQTSAETDAQRASREYRDEVATFSSCIFGNSELMAYKGTSTKVHVVPSDSRPSECSSVLGDGRSSIGRSSGRSSKLSQSFSSHQAVSPTMGPPQTPYAGTPSRFNDKKKILITRLFPVNLSVDDGESDATPQSRLSDDNGAFPFPMTSAEDIHSSRKKPQPRQRRTPMYAVVLVVHLPRSSSRMSSAAPPRVTTAFREPGSYTEPEFCPSSFSSAKATWNLFGTHAEAAESACSVDIEDRIDTLTQHWDIIMRTLNHLQSHVASTLHTMLKNADIASPGSYSSSTTSNLMVRSPPISDRRGSDITRPIKSSKSTTKLVSLWHNCLADDSRLASEVVLARNRIVTGLSAARVVTGQGRWGIWRDEAIWTCRWAASTEQSLFFCNLLTGFLAIHSSWLEALWGSSYCKRTTAAHNVSNEDDLSLPARTVIVSNDKMAARRMIFLLSAFLPASQQMAATRTYRPGTSASFGGFFNSPPSYIVPMLREESLRRKINRRSGLRRTSHSRAASQGARNSAMLSTQLAQLGMERGHQQRRASDAASVRTMGVPMPGLDLAGRKSSAGPTAAIIAEATTPHFSSAHQHVENQMRRRPGSSGSAAADDLKRSLQRGDSSGQSGTANARLPGQGIGWGSLVSGLWSSRRRESIDAGNPPPNAGELRSPLKPGFNRVDKLMEMAQDISVVEETAEDDFGPVSHATPVPSFETRREDLGRDRGSFAQVDRTPDPNGAFESPVKTSINAEDGVIDVDVAFPEYIASFESAISSPSSSGYLSTPGIPVGLESFEHSSRFALDGDFPPNAAGWLKRFHPDFVLQALPPQDNLVETIKASLGEEATPCCYVATKDDQTERWVDVGSVIIADATSNSVTRHVYRRLVKARPPLNKAGPGHHPAPSLNGSVPLTPLMHHDDYIKEEWTEEEISFPDEALKEAVDKAMNVTRETRKTGATTSPQEQDDGRQDADMQDTLSEMTQLPEPCSEVPRTQCKAVILSALEDMLRDAIDQRDLDGHGNEGHGRQSLLRDAVRQWVANNDAAD
ncbi:hypothetical protein CDD81_1221 [Ophiocordyceps australis]|uniref:Folliculin-interacting protein N-terminal domain-containing protein n=1 Tax=Ophiocordyceps australis TaxID=1399860 RepID=A0A2C5YEZ0_9HYPO|nr:hypothetical protein CDD81_1221 [Ophiocordyceps australis]